MLVWEHCPQKGYAATYTPDTRGATGDGLEGNSDAPLGRIIRGINGAELVPPLRIGD